MYAVTSMPLVRRTRATFRSAEFGFFGVVVYTRVQTPRRWGEPFNAGVLFLLTLSVRPLRTSCWIVGTACCLFLLRGCGCGSAARLLIHECDTTAKARVLEPTSGHTPEPGKPGHK